MMRHLLVVAALVAGVAPALANSLVAPGPTAGIAKSRLSAKPVGEWNRLSLREGRNVEVWTIDGDALNKVSFYAGVAGGDPLVREADAKRQPLPKVSATMLPTDIPALLEQIYRSRNLVSRMSIGGQEPTTLAGRKAIRFTYAFTRLDDEVERSGEGVGAIVDGRLYLVTYEAPALHFFDKDVEKYRQLVASFAL